MPEVRTIEVFVRLGGEAGMMREVTRTVERTPGSTYAYMIRLMRSADPHDNSAVTIILTAHEHFWLCGEDALSETDTQDVKVPQS